MNISQQFSPPFKLIAPFFIIGLAALMVAIVLLFGVDASGFDLLQNSTLAWVHLFILGFVMMVIFGAMAQLIPVVLEVEHFAVELYYAIFPLLFIGIVMIVFGFLYTPILLPFGGVVALIAFGIYLAETFLTMRKVKRITFVVVTVFFANISLLIGLSVALVMALGYSGIISVDIHALLKLHIYFVVLGYIGMTVMAMSLILLPMFLLSHIKSWKIMKIALGLLCSALVLMVLHVTFEIELLSNIAHAFVLISFGLYGYEIFKIYKTRMRVESDIYFKSMVFSYGSFFIMLLGIVLSLVVASQSLLLATGWIGFAGFITFLISGHLYKIVPFLIWYERFSPLVGKQNVPMLADMIPERSAAMQFILSSIGVVLIALGILMSCDALFKSGASFLVFGIIFLIHDIVYIMRYR